MRILPLVGPPLDTTRQKAALTAELWWQKTNTSTTALLPSSTYTSDTCRKNYLLMIVINSCYILPHVCRLNFSVVYLSIYTRDIKIINLWWAKCAAFKDARVICMQKDRKAESVTVYIIQLSIGSLTNYFWVRGASYFKLTFSNVYIYTSGFKHVSLRRFKFQSVWDYHFDLINDYLKINKLTRLQHQFTYLMSHDSHNSCILYIWKVRANFVRT